MSTNATAEELASSIGLEAVPENIRRLTALVSRQEAPMEEIAKLICQDKELTNRLLRAANPRAASADEYAVTSVEAALMRAGVGCALLLAMGDPLIRAVKRTFHTMAGEDLIDVAPGILAPLEEDHVVCQLTFAGKATGSVVLRFSPDAARSMAAQILGYKPDDLNEASDVVGELGNMVVGNFKSNLCDAGLECKLNPPEVTISDEFRLRANGGLAERVGFQSNNTELFVDILVNPWN